MTIIGAYLGVIIIWSTTPLAIQWSNQGVGYEFGVALRMLVGLSALLLMTRLWRLPLPFNQHGFLVYGAGGLSLFFAMSLVYWSAQMIPSGWISLIFGLTPLFTSLFAAMLLGEKSFTPSKTLGMLLGFGGLALVFVESRGMHANAWWGVVGVSVASMIHSLGSVLLKKLTPEMPAISITAGSLLLATPLFAANSLLQGLPDQISTHALSAILYLGLFGSAIGFPLYFYCLKHLQAERVALITLITPVCALLLGAWLNDETIRRQIWLGSGLILGGLAIYEYGRYLPWSRRGRRWRQHPL